MISGNDLRNVTQKKRIHFLEFFPIPEYFYTLYLIVKTAIIFSFWSLWMDRRKSYSSKFPLRMSKSANRCVLSNEKTQMNWWNTALYFPKYVQTIWQKKSRCFPKSIFMKNEVSSTVAIIKILIHKYILSDDEMASSSHKIADLYDELICIGKSFSSIKSNFSLLYKQLPN